MKEKLKKKNKRRERKKEKQKKIKRSWRGKDNKWNERVRIKHKVGLREKQINDYLLTMFY